MWALLPSPAHSAQSVPWGVQALTNFRFKTGVTMKLLLRRDQKSGMLSSSITFMLNVRADLSNEELENISKYKMGKTVLYARDELIDRGKGLIGLASRVAFKMMNISVAVDDLVNGKRIDCKDIMEMLAVEEQIKEACQNFKSILEAAAHFGGEEVIEY